MSTNDQEPRYSYRLKLEVQEHEKIATFNACSTARFQGDLKEQVAHCVCRALQAAMNDPPQWADIVNGMLLSYEKIAGLAYAYRNVWDAEKNFDDCVDITINLSKLCGTEDDQEELATHRRVLMHHGITVMEQEQEHES